MQIEEYRNGSDQLLENDQTEYRYDIFNADIILEWWQYAGLWIVVQPYLDVILDIVVDILVFDDDVLGFNCFPGCTQVPRRFRHEHERYEQC